MLIDFRPSTIAVGVAAVAFGYANLTGINVRLLTTTLMKQGRTQIANIRKDSDKYLDKVTTLSPPVAGEAQILIECLTDQPCSSPKSQPATNYSDLPGVTRHTTKSKTVKSP